jgi:hypothetical protein
MRCAVPFLPQDQKPVEEESEDTAFGGPSGPSGQVSRSEVGGGLAGSWWIALMHSQQRIGNVIQMIRGASRGSCPQKKRLQKKGT